MLDHIGITVSDFTASKNFYSAALKPLGFELLMEIPAEVTGHSAVAGFGAAPKPEFWISAAAHNAPVHVALRVSSRTVVDEFYRAALAAGAKDNGAPGIRAHYHPHYYGAFVRDPDGHNIDPDGHNIEAVCHDPA
jgi:catechol 2,3-dioxygenase-like lactoylglutathione lyase family enzyme